MIVRLLILAPFLLFLVLFALSNPAPVHLGLWPTDLGIELPMSLAILVGMGLAFLVGGLFVWLSALGQRQRARRAEARVRALDAQVAGLKAQISPGGLPPVGLRLPPPV